MLVWCWLQLCGDGAALLVLVVVVVLAVAPVSSALDTTMPWQPGAWWRD